MGRKFASFVRTLFYHRYAYTAVPTYLNDYYTQLDGAGAHDDEFMGGKKKKFEMILRLLNFLYE